MLKSQIHRLEVLGERYPRYTVFGDDNHAAMEAQRAVLEGRVTNEMIYKQGWPEHVERAAAEADTWMRGYTPEATPSDDWEAKLKNGGSL